MSQVVRRYRNPSKQSGRIDIALSCGDCGARNYKTTKAAREGAAAIKLSKFCSHCNKHTIHLESK